MVNVNIELWHICENQYYCSQKKNIGMLNVKKKDCEDKIIYTFCMVMEHQFEVSLFVGRYLT